MEVMWYSQSNIYGIILRLHPRTKPDVAQRLALAARGVAYSEAGLDYQAPFPSSFTLTGTHMIIEYDNGNKIINVKNSKGFEVKM